MWVLDHLPDIESDMSVFHRVDNIYLLDGPMFFSRVFRLGAYQGVISALAAEEHERKTKKLGSGRTMDRQVEKTVDAAQASRELPDLFEHTTVK